MNFTAKTKKVKVIRSPFFKVKEGDIGDLTDHTIEDGGKTYFGVTFGTSYIHFFREEELDEACYCGHFLESHKHADECRAGDECLCRSYQP